MKNHIIQILLSIILTALALFLGLLFSIETPVKTTENYTLLWVVVLNGLWFIPYSIYYWKNDLNKDSKISILIFSLISLPFLIVRIYTPSFDSEKWKSSINENRTYGGTPAYSQGHMVQDLIESEILIGKSLNEIELIIGENHFTQQYSDSNTIWYFYQNKSFLDGCDKVYIEFEKKLSIKAGIGGCD
jgi:hypothetical protein